MKKHLPLTILLIFSTIPFYASDSVKVSTTDLTALVARIEKLEQTLDSTQKESPKVGMNEAKGERLEAKSKEQKGRFTVGGYGEATMKRCYYSNNYLRYTSPDLYKNDQYGEFDLPHVVIWMGYDFGKGWSVGTEIEFEHGGPEVAVEIEAEEGGEYETEVERGGEVALEQFWLQKSFNQHANIRAGMIIVPLGGTNAHHEPDKFFGVYRPEGDNTILPCTWHEVGVQFHGRYNWLGYTAQFLPGLESARFGSQTWIAGGSASSYEFKLANTYAGLVRLDFYPLAGTPRQSPHRPIVSSPKKVDALRISLSGYVGTSFKNNLTPTTNKKYEGVKGLVSLAALDWQYKDHGWIFRGSATYGHIDEADMITSFNKSMSKNSVSKKQNVASDAYTAGAEIGYDFFSLNHKLREKHQQFYVFARYDIYDAQARIDASRNYWAGRQKVSCGFNYFPIPQVVVKGEFGYGILNQNPYSDTKYNNEPYIAFGINYYGLFKM